MKETFIIWITIQLIAIGVANSLVWNEIVDKTYNCHRTISHMQIGVAILFPLAFFVSDHQMEKEYCLKAN